MTEIGHRVRRVREALQLNQTDFAARMRYGRQHISSIERGKTPAGRRFLEQLQVLEREASVKSRNDANTSPQTDPLFGGIVEPSESLLQERPSSSVPPPHVPLEPRRESSPKTTNVSHEEYVEAVNILGRLMERNPDSFRVALATLRAMNQTIK
jgi:transcriptional regulator with XRE-family HTH domain